MLCKRAPESYSRTVAVSEIQGGPAASFTRIAGMSDTHTGSSPAILPKDRVQSRLMECEACRAPSSEQLRRLTPGQGRAAKHLMNRMLIAKQTKSHKTYLDDQPTVRELTRCPVQCVRACSTFVGYRQTAK